LGLVDRKGSNSLLSFIAGSLASRFCMHFARPTLASLHIIVIKSAYINPADNARERSCGIRPARMAADVLTRYLRG
jgi:hypothetical protein